MVRDEELKRLIKYAEGLNVKVKFRPYDPKRGSAAEWATDGTEITIFEKKDDSKLSLILALIHELGHHLEHIHNNNRMPDPKLEEAIGEDESKRMRKRLYDWEVKSSEWWDIIYKETDCQFNIKRLEQEKVFDLWQYEVYYETGKFPNRQEQREKRRIIKN